MSGKLFKLICGAIEENKTQEAIFKIIKPVMQTFSNDAFEAAMKWMNETRVAGGLEIRKSYIMMMRSAIDAMKEPHFENFLRHFKAQTLASLTGGNFTFSIFDAHFHTYCSSHMDVINTLKSKFCADLAMHFVEDVIYQELLF